MINSINISGANFDLDETTKRYVIKKIGRLDRYLPRHARKSASAEVKLKLINKDFGNKYEAEVVLVVPNKVITSKDSTVNVLAALDIVEAKIATQLHKYKEEHIPHVGKRGVLARFKRSYAREAA